MGGLRIGLRITRLVRKMPFTLGAQDPAVKHAALIQAVAKVLGADPNDVLGAALDADPTRRDYIGWILKQMKFGNVILPEDAPRVIEALATLEEAKRVRYQGVEFDINKYKTIGDLEAVTDRIIDAESGRERERPRQIEDLPEGVILHAESEHYQILEVTDPNACIYLSRGTKWCTRQSDVAKEYLKQHGKLYVILALDGSQWVVYGQYTPYYEQVKDTKNKRMVIDDLELADLMRPDLETPDAAKIFYNYANRVIQGRWPEGEAAISQDPEWAFKYASRVIRGRWPEAEPFIAQNPKWASKYASIVIRSRWPEDEIVIAQDPEGAFNYATAVIQGRWPEGEAAISQDPKWASKYASSVIRGRWPEGESAIARHPLWAYYYVYSVIQGRWPEGEAAISQDPEWASKYARFVFRGRWPEGEAAIAQDPRWAREYLLYSL
jgi:uncharacterized protein YeaC (DUF1315 family)